MSDPNPYQPPALDEAPEQTHLARMRVGKTWLSPGMICLLMPPAIRIVMFISESAALMLIYAMQSTEVKLTVPLFVALMYGPAVATVVAMLWWAVRVDRRERRQKLRPRFSAM